MMCASVAWAESGLFKADCMVDSCCAAGRVFPFSQERFLVIARSPSHTNITRSTELSMIQSSSSTILRDLGEYNILITTANRLDESLCRGLNNFALTIENWIVSGNILELCWQQDAKKIRNEIRSHLFSFFGRFMVTHSRIFGDSFIHPSACACCMMCGVVPQQCASLVWHQKFGSSCLLKRPGADFFFGFAGDLVDLFP